MTIEATINRFRVLLAAAALLYPAWGAIERWLSPGGEDGIPGRLSVSAFCVAVIGATYVGKLRRHTEFFCLAACCVIVTHNAFLVRANSLGLDYVLGYTLVVFGLAVSFESLKLFLGFIVYTVAVTTLTSMGGYSDRHLYIGAAMMALSMSYLAFRDKLRILAKLRRKNAELETSRMFLRNTAEAANIGGWSLDLETRSLWWSEQTYLIHEMPLDAPLGGVAALDFYPAEVRGVLADAYDRAVHEQRPYDLEVPFVTAKGRQRWVRAIGKPVVQGGRTTAIYGSIQDVTDQVRRKEGDQRTSQLLANVLANLPHGVFAKDLKNGSRYVIWNKGMESLLKVQADDVLGRDDSFLFDQKVMRRVARLDQLVLEGRTLLDLAEEEVHTKLVRFPARTKRVPVFDAKGEPELILGIVEDISEMKKRETQIRDQQTQLLHASRMSTLGEMSGGVAHEINNPLTIIMGFTRKIELALAAGKLDPEDLVRSTGKITAMTERIAKIVRGLKTFAREASQDPFTPSPVRQIIDESLDLCRERLVNAGIELKVGEVSHDLVAECRAIQISQVLVNLLNNAHDAVQDLPARWIELAVQELDDSIEISITDSGDGIPPDVAEKMLQPFFTTKGVGVGTGLGLSISKGIMESHGGRLYYDPASAHTRFVATFPKRQSRDRAA